MLDLNDIHRPHHPVSAVFPMMTGAEFGQLVDDIRTHGLREPIWLDRDGHILDGRNRDRACLLSGTPPAYRIYHGGDPAAFIVSLNLHRRHLNESQRAMVGARLAIMRQGERTDLSPIGERLSQADAATLVNVGKRNVERAVKVFETGTPELVRAVDEGLVAVSDAAVVADRPAEEQQALVETVRAGQHKTLRRAAVARRRDARETPPDRLPQAADRFRLFVTDVTHAAEQLEPSSIDCIVCDPPYPREFLPVYGELARTAAQVLKPGGSCLVMVGQSYLPEILAAMTLHLRYHWTLA